MMPKKPPIKIEMSAYKFDDIIMKETEKFAKENPEQMEKAMWKDSFAHLAFRVLANVIRKRMVEETIVHCPRCNKETRADILHTCSPGDWKPVKAG